MSDKKPFIEFGDDFIMGLIYFIVYGVFVLTFVTFVFGFFALFVTFIQTADGNWTNFLITLGIYILNILICNIKRIGSFENPIYILWRTPLNDA